MTETVWWWGFFSRASSYITHTTAVILIVRHIFSVISWCIVPVPPDGEAGERSQKRDYDMTNHSPMPLKNLNLFQYDTLRIVCSHVSYAYCVLHSHRLPMHLQLLTQRGANTTRLKCRNNSNDDDDAVPKCGSSSFFTTVLWATKKFPFDGQKISFWSTMKKWRQILFWW